MTINNHVSGKKFGYLMLTGKSYLRNHKTYLEVVCLNCDCSKWMRRDVIKKSKSCGCFNEYTHSKKENIGVITHGLSKHPLYTVFRGIVNRCYSEKHKAYVNYGANGVIICEEWRNNFLSFYNWAIANGWEKGKEIDKDIKYVLEFGTKSGKEYSPKYCSILSRKDNAQLKSTTIFLKYKGETKTINEWAKITFLKPNTIALRLFKKWTVEKTLTTPLRKKVPVIMIARK